MVHSCVAIWNFMVEGLLVEATVKTRCASFLSKDFSYHLQFS